MVGADQPDDLVRMQVGIRTTVLAWGRGAGQGFRRASPWAVVGALVAGAIAPVVWPLAGAAGMSAVLGALVGQVGNVGAGYLVEVVTKALDRARQAGDGESSPAQLAGGRGYGLNEDDRTARLWDVATHQQIAILPGHASGVEALAFSPNGHMLATDNLDHTVRDVSTHQQIAILPGHTSGVDAVTFSPDGTTVGERPGTPHERPPSSSLVGVLVVPWSRARRVVFVC